MLVIGTIVSGCANPGVVGDSDRGRKVFVEREQGHCVRCHAVPGVQEAGNLGPPLAGVGSRLTPAEIRVRVADITQVNPDAAMPAFRKAEGLHRVAPAYANRMLLSESQLDDVVAYLASLK
jgi:sulfur-oxidizing protein SoxX